jgi:hypothetical protein
MLYDGKTGRITIDVVNLKTAYQGFMRTLVKIRQHYGLPLHPYKRQTILSESDQTQKNIIDTAKCVGIYLGADWGNEIDLSDFSPD